LRLLLVLIVSSMLSGCASIAVTLAGLGFGAGASHYMSSVNYRTFTEPLQTVRQAVLTSLWRMQIELASSERTDQGMLFKARTSNRDIEIELEAVTERSTRMRTVAHPDGGLLLDASTAAEISSQTEKALAEKSAAAPAAVPVPTPVRTGSAAAPAAVPVPTPVRTARRG
jgi:hypothetical protein